MPTNLTASQTFLVSQAERHLAGQRAADLRPEQPHPDRGRDPATPTWPAASARPAERAAAALTKQGSGHSSLLSGTNTYTGQHHHRQRGHPGPQSGGTPDAPARSTLRHVQSGLSRSIPGRVQPQTGGTLTTTNGGPALDIGDGLCPLQAAAAPCSFATNDSLHARRQRQRPEHWHRSTSATTAARARSPRRVAAFTTNGNQRRHRAEPAQRLRQRHRCQRHCTKLAARHSDAHRHGFAEQIYFSV